MSDTVQIAIITFLSGAVGAICGIIGSHLSSKTSAKAEIQKAVLNKYFNVRMNAYTKLISAFDYWGNNIKDDVARSHLSKEITCAYLVASDKTKDALMHFQDACYSLSEENKDSKEFKLSGNFVDARIQLFECMHHDLLHFSLPNIDS